MGELLSTFFSSIIGGGATGLLGIIVQRLADYKNKQLDIQISKEKMAHEIALRKVDAEILAQEWASRTKVAEIEGASREAVADAQAFSASFIEPVKYSEGVKKSRGQAWLFVVLDFIRGIVRPLLTFYLCVITTYIYLQVKELMGVPIDPSQGMDLLKQIVGTILYLCTTCCLWFFGTRNKGSANFLK